jgi:DNA-binding CsgD family transcriptional regulator
MTDEVETLDDLLDGRSAKARKRRVLDDHSTQALEALSDAKSLEDIRNVLLKYAEGLGAFCFTYFSGSLSRDVRRIEGTPFSRVTNCIQNFPDAWVTRYFEGEYHCHDPVIIISAMVPTPVKWRDIGLLFHPERRLESPLASMVPPEVVKRLTKESTRIMMDAVGFGLATGISVPIHGQWGLFSLLSIAFSNSGPEVEAQIDAMERGVQLVALEIHSAVLRIEGPWIEEPVLTQLAPREKEILKLAAIGKTNSEIGDILDISEHTVREYFRRISNKLGVATRTQAIVDSVAYGLTH